MQRSRRLLVVIALSLAVTVGGTAVALPWLRSYGSPRSPWTGTGESVSIRVSTLQDIVAGQPVRFGAGSKVLRVYLDFHCADCADFAKRYGATIDQAVRDGRAQLAIYPLAVIDDGSASAANAYACAAEGGAAAEYLAGLSVNPGLRWTDRQLIGLGDLVGTNFTPAFAACVHAKSHRTWVNSMDGVAAADGVSQTPAVFLGADRIDVATLTPERLQALLRG